MTEDTTSMVKVLYILGSSRCGSTILDNVLNEVEGFFSVGEMRFLWERLVEGLWCGCGRPIRDCPVYSAVLSRGFGYPGRDHFDIQQAALWQHQALRVKHTWRLLAGTQRPESHRAARAYADVTQTLYRTVSEVTGARVIIDSSKRPSNGALAAMLPGVSTYFIHMVRDPRAMAYSRQRYKLNPNREIPKAMPRKGSLNSALFWVGMNAAAEAVLRRHDPSRVMRLRYEDFVADPPSAVRSIVRFVREEAPSLPFLDARTVSLRGNHSVSGNPSRFKTGLVGIKNDDEWEQEMPGLSRRVVTLLTLPLLARYRYPVRSGGQHFRAGGPDTNPRIDKTAG
jgi:hypothetical protein